MAKPKVSIITPSYNSVRFIEDTLKSIQVQDYPHLEHIVMDGGSTDGTVEILKLYQGTYNLIWQSEPDRGQSHAYNKAIQIATGEWFLFLNSDDFLLDKTSITQVVDAIQQATGFSIYMGHIQSVDENGKILTQSSHHGMVQLDQHILLNVLPICIHQATLTHYRVFEKVGLFDESFFYHMDFEFLLRASKFFDIRLVEVFVSALRKHPGAKTQKTDYRSPLEMIKARRLNGGSLSNKFNRIEVRRLISRLLVSVSRKI